MNDCAWRTFQNGVLVGNELFCYKGIKGTKKLSVSKRPLKFWCSFFVYILIQSNFDGVALGNYPLFPCAGAVRGEKNPISL